MGKRTTNKGVASLIYSQASKTIEGGEARDIDTGFQVFRRRAPSFKGHLEKTPRGKPRKETSKKNTPTREEFMAKHPGEEAGNRPTK